MNLLPLHGAVATLLAPALRLMLARRVRRGKEIAARLGERRGIERTARPKGPLLWMHAASVGETVSVLPLLVKFAAISDAQVLMTTGTVTSAALLERRLPELGLAGRVRHRFVPLDVPGWCGRFLDHWRPDLAVFVESEIWPGLLAACARRGIRRVLVNARLSPRSFAHWRRVPGTARALFGGFGLVQAQTAADAARLAALGAPASPLTGNLKYAADPLPVDEAELARLRQVLGDRPAWLAASTHPGEDAVVLGVHRRLLVEFPGLLTIVVPRHPERGAAIAAGVGELRAARRGLGEDPPPGGLWVGDTLGELGLYYRLAGIAFMGKSLGGEAGGQNPLEAARLGCAVATGVAVQNFMEITADLAAAGALAQVPDEAGLADWVALMLREPARRTAMGEAGLAAAAGAAELPGQLAGMLAGMLGTAR